MENNTVAALRMKSCRTLSALVVLTLLLLNLMGCSANFSASKVHENTAGRPGKASHVSLLPNSDAAPHYQKLWTERQPPPQLSKINYSPEPISRYGNPKQYAVAGKKYFPRYYPEGYTQVGKASWYGKKFHGRPTSSGEKYNMYSFTAAHRTMLLPSIVRVTNLKNNRSTVVKVNDRGPFYEDRIIDLSYRAAKALNMLEDGVVLVKVELISPPKSRATHQLPAQSEQQRRKSAGLENKPAYLQVGSFERLSNAQASASRLDKLRLNAKIVDYRSGTQSLYRVVIGPFYSHNSVYRAENTLRKEGFSHIVRVYNLDLVPFQKFQKPVTSVH